MNGLPLSPLVYELGNSLISSLALCVVAILCWFFSTEMQRYGSRVAYRRVRFRLGLAIAAVMVGEAGYRMWTWWGRYCANTDASCAWMLTKAWPFVPGLSIALQLVGMLCMIRILIPEVWGTRAWIVSAALSASWSFYWFSGWDDVLETLQEWLR